MQFIDLQSQYARLKNEVQSRINQVLDHGQYIMGNEVKECEQVLSDFIKVKHCITVSSGTEALLIALMAMGIKRGDEIITTPFTFIATAEVIALLGAVPVLVDIDPVSYNINHELIPQAISKKTKAIMPVSLFGQVSNMNEINEIATQHGLIVIEDGAQSFGAKYYDKYSCALSDFGCTSFFPSKPLGCYGDGGAIFTNNDTMAQICREIRTHGQERRYYHTRIGLGGRMDTLQCAIILAKMTIFAQEIAIRQQIGAQFQALLADIPQITPPIIADNRTSVWAQFCLLANNRDEIISNLQKHAIPTAVHYPICVHQQPAYQKICKISRTLAIAESVADKIFSIPFHPYLTAQEIARISDILKQ